ncbi:hypothetical protein ACN20G_29545 (plasmid) [Streptomyces sp. BI20]|uniref:hypothetical protein n=1 Tax=Streptomyces sp. BI20 TaxID=3403460 RepID=UPI003C765EA5
MTLDELYTTIVAEEIEETGEPERLPVLTRAEIELALAVLDAVAYGETDDEVRTTARALRSRLDLRLPEAARTGPPPTVGLSTG